MFPLKTEFQLLIAAGIFAGGFFLGSALKQAAWTEENLAEARERILLTQANAARINKLEIEQNANQVEIDRLRANNHALWLRLPKTPCGGVAASSVSGTATASDKPLPTDPQEAFNRFNEGLGELMHEADTVVNNCAALQKWAQGLNTAKKETK